MMVQFEGGWLGDTDLYITYMYLAPTAVRIEKAHCRIPLPILITDQQALYEAVKHCQGWLMSAGVEVRG